MQHSCEIFSTKFYHHW